MTTVTLAWAVAVALVQSLLWLIARGLQRPLGRRPITLGLLLPLLLLLPWLDGDRAPAPLEVLTRSVPGKGAMPPVDRYARLSETVTQFLPWEAEVRRAVSERRLPLWSDRLGDGFSPWVDPQRRILDPLSWAARLLPLRSYLLVSAWLKLMVAVQGAWILCRILGLGRVATAVGALSFALGGGMTGWLLFPNSGVAAWAPWLVAGSVLLARRPSPPRVATTGLVAAFALLSGHPDPALAAALLAGVAALCFARRRQLRRGVAALALAAILGVGLSAVQLVPMLVYLPNSLRAEEAAARPQPDPLAVGPWLRSGILRAFVGPLHPHLFGRPYSADESAPPLTWPGVAPTYSGLVVAAGALAAVAGRRRKQALGLLAFGGLTMLLAAGFPPLAFAWTKLPLVGAGNFSRYVLISALALALVGALGVETVLRARRPSRFSAGALGLGVVGLALGGWQAPTAVLWALVASAPLLLRPALPGRGATGGLLLLVVLFDLLPWARDLVPRSPSSLWVESTQLLDRLRARADDLDPWRLAAPEGDVSPHLLALYGLSDIRPHNAIMPSALGKVLAATLHEPTRPFGFALRVARPEHPLLDFLNVRFFVSRQPIGTVPGFTLLDDGAAEGWHLYRNMEALPRYFLVSRLQLASANGVLDALRDLADAETVIARRGDLVWREPETAWSIDAVQILDHSDGRVELSVPGTGDRLLATSLAHPAGWSAHSGRGVRLARTTINGAFAGFTVPSGVERLTLRFSPPGLVPGALTSLLSALALSGLVSARWRRSGNPRHPRAGRAARAARPVSRDPGTAVSSRLA